MRFTIGIVLTWLLLPANAHACVLVLRQSQVAPCTGIIICYPACGYIFDPCPVLFPGPGPVPNPKKYAREKAAPPSSTPLDPALFAKRPSATAAPSRPSVGTRGAVVEELRPYFDIYPLVPQTGSAPGDRIPVQFWNQTERDLNLTIDGQRQLVRRGDKLPLTLGRKFSWQVDNRAAETAEVAAGQAGLEIVIRR